MPETIQKNRRLIALSLLGCVLLNYPILSLFNLNITLMGIPLLYLYIFAVWFLLIILIAFATKSSRKDAETQSVGKP